MTKQFQPSKGLCDQQIKVLLAVTAAGKWKETKTALYGLFTIRRVTVKAVLGPLGACAPECWNKISFVLRQD